MELTPADVICHLYGKATEAKEGVVKKMDILRNDNEDKGQGAMAKKRNTATQKVNNVYYVKNDNDLDGQTLAAHDREFKLLKEE